MLVFNQNKLNQTWLKLKARGSVKKLFFNIYFLVFIYSTIMFLGNIKIEKGVKVMNAIEDGKFPLLLNRIAQFMSSDSTCKPFTETEESKLESSLEITKTEVQILIEAIIEIFRLCAYYMIKPPVLHDHLEKDMKLEFKKTEIFVQTWLSSAKAIVDNLKQKAFLPQLGHMSYNVSVATSSNSTSKEKSVLAQLQLGLYEDNKCDNVNIEFSHEELFEFYKKLEQVQSQLDALR